MCGDVELIKPGLTHFSVYPIVLEVEGRETLLSPS